MNPELQQLKDIHLPQVINMWWPLAPGWYVVIALMFVIGIVITYIWRKYAQERFTARFAQAKLRDLQKLLLNNPDNINIAAEVSTLIRRTALCYFPREEIAGLSGSEWLNFLNRTGNTTEFTQAIGRLLTDVPYQKNGVAELDSLFKLTNQWLAGITSAAKKDRKNV